MFVDLLAGFVVGFVIGFVSAYIIGILRVRRVAKECYIAIDFLGKFCERMIDSCGER